MTPKLSKENDSGEKVVFQSFSQRVNHVSNNWPSFQSSLETPGIPTTNAPFSSVGRLLATSVIGVSILIHPFGAWCAYCVGLLGHSQAEDLLGFSSPLSGPGRRGRRVWSTPPDPIEGKEGVARVCHLPLLPYWR